MDIFDIVGPFLFILLALAGAIANALKKNKEGQETEEQGGEAAERARRVREEIRRRMAEAQRRLAGEPEADHAPQPMQPQAEPRQATAPMEMPRGMPTPAEMHSPSGPSVQDRLQEQRRRLQETQAERQRALEQVERAERKAQRDEDYQRATTYRSTRKSGDSLLNEIREGVSDPDAARRAFLYLEVFGPPVGLRQASGFRPIADQ